MMRFTLFGPVLLACLAALAGLWGSLDAYAQGLAVGAIYGGLALLGPMLLIGRSVQQGAAGDELDELDELDAPDGWECKSGIVKREYDSGLVCEERFTMLVPKMPRVVSVERPQPKQLTGGNR